MQPEDKPTASDLAAEIMGADRISTPEAEEPPPVAWAFDPFALFFYPFLRRHRRRLTPWLIALTVIGWLLVFWLKLYH